MGVGGALAEEIVECAERTLAEASARIEVRQAVDFSFLRQARRPKRRGGLLRPLVKVAHTASRRMLAIAGRRWMGELCLQGFIEPSRRRHMANAGAWAEVKKHGVRWAGSPGVALAALEPGPRKGSALDLWWLLDGLRGVIEASALGEDSVRGMSCRRLAARVDLARASAASPGGLRPPAVDRFEDLLALPIEVWIDGAHVRRVRFEGWLQGEGALTLELWDFDVSTDQLDWSRLPARQALSPPHGAPIFLMG